MEGKTLFSWLNSTTFKLVFFGGVSAVSIYFVVKSFSKAPIRPILKEVDFTKALPEEVILQVFRHCNAEDLAQASQVCKEWNRFTGDDQVWKEIYLKQWRKVESNLSLELQPRHKSSWKEMYIERFVIEKVCFPRKKAIFSADSVQGLMYKASKLIEKAQNFSSSSLATSTELHYAVTPFSLLAVAAESYEACFVLETERKEKVKTSQASAEEKDNEEKEEADRKLEAEILWRWGLVLIKQAAYVPEEDIAEKERLLDLGHDKCEQSLYLHDNLKKRLKLANRFFNRATSLRGSEEARFIFLFKKARAHYRLALQTIEDEEVNHEGEKQGEPANDEVFDELLGVKKRNFSIEKAKAYRQLGWAYYSEVESLSERGQSVLEMLKASRDCYKYALEYEPESVESFSQMAKVLSLMGKIIEDREEADANMQEALTYYRRSIMYNGKDPDLLNQYGILLIASAQKREGDEVERLYSEAEDIFVRLEKISWFGGINLACLSAIRGREEETKKWLVKCFKNDHLELEHLEDRDFDGFREKDWFLELVTALEGREDNN